MPHLWLFYSALLLTTLCGWMHHHWPLKISAHGGLRWQKMQKFHNRNCEIEACLYSGTGARQKDGLINERHSLITCDFRILSKSSHGLQMVGVLPFQDLTMFTTPRSSSQLFAAPWTILNKIFWKELKLLATHMGEKNGNRAWTSGTWAPIFYFWVCEEQRHGPC